MNLEQRLSEEQKAHILNEVERARRKVLVSRLYEEGMSSTDEGICLGTAISLHALASVDSAKFVELYKKGITNRLFEVVRTDTAGSLGGLASVDPDKFIELYEQGLISGNGIIIRETARSLGALATVDPDKYTELLEKGLRSGDYSLRKYLEPLKTIDFTKYAWSCRQNSPIRYFEKDFIKPITNPLEILASADYDKFIGLYDERMSSDDEGVRFETARSLRALAAVNPLKYIELYKKGIGDDNPDNNTLRYEIACSLKAFASTIKDDVIVPIKDEGYNFFASYLDSVYIKDEDGLLRDVDDITKELVALAGDSKVDYKKLSIILKVGEAKDLDEMVECANIKIPQYTLLTKLGSGGSRDAYLARKDDCDIDTVLKIFRIDFLKEKVSDYRSRHDLREIFRREVTNLKTLRHANLVRIFNHGDYGDTFYIEEEYMNGGTLESYVESEDFVMGTAVQRMVEIIDCVDYLHSSPPNGRVVRDIKLDNILLTKIFRYHYGDGFQMISQLDDLEMMGELGKLTKDPKKTTNTNRYAAPELMRGEEATTASDVYAIGCCLFYIFSRNKDREFIAKINTLPKDEYERRLKETVMSTRVEHVLPMFTKVGPIDEPLLIPTGEIFPDLLLNYFLAYDKSKRINLTELYLTGYAMQEASPKSRKR